MLVNKQQKIIEVISVAVITYHSAATVIETLDSILSQTFGSENIELIISDDGSKDNTVQVIENWLVRYVSRFRCVNFISNKVNGGVSKNCNVAWNAATSEWIKTIAGDDILANECIEMNVAYVISNPDARIVFSQMAHFISNKENVFDISPHVQKESFFSLSSEMQYKYLLCNSFNVAPTSFISASVLKAVGYCDEQYKLIEDLPLWLRITKSGFSLSFFNSITVFYRKSNSISQSTERLVNVDFINQMWILSENEIWPNFAGLSKWRIIDAKINYYSWLIPARLFDNKRHFLSVFMQRFLCVFRPSLIQLLYMRLVDLCKNKR